MESSNSNQRNESIQVPSVNTQVLAGVILAGLWMNAISRKLKVVVNNQKVIAGGLDLINDHISVVHHDAVTVREVVRLASMVDPKSDS